MPNFPPFPTLNRYTFGPVAPGSSNEYKPRVLTANFGGGYSQRSADGANALPRLFTYRSAPLRPADMAVLTQFLAYRQGYYPFMFLVPNEATPRQWTCDSWREEYSSPTHSTLTATFEENFDP